MWQFFAIAAIPLSLSCSIMNPTVKAMNIASETHTKVTS
jgi:hypothetical protein